MDELQGLLLMEGLPPGWREILEAEADEFHRFSVHEIFADCAFVLKNTFGVTSTSLAPLKKERTGKALVEYTQKFITYVQSQDWSPVEDEEGESGEVLHPRTYGGSYLVAPLTDASRFIEKLHRILKGSKPVKDCLKGWINPKAPGHYTLGKALFSIYLSLSASYFLLFSSLGSSEGIPSVFVKKMLRNVAWTIKVFAHFVSVWGKMNPKEFKADVEQRFKEGEFKRLEYFTVQTSKYLAKLDDIIGEVKVPEKAEDEGA